MPTNGYFNTNYPVGPEGTLLSPPAQTGDSLPDGGSFVVPAAPEVRIGGDDQAFADCHVLTAGSRFYFSVSRGTPFLITAAGTSVDGGIDVLWEGIN